MPTQLPFYPVSTKLINATLDFRDQTEGVSLQILDREALNGTKVK